jgi:hypothetical protein
MEIGIEVRLSTGEVAALKTEINAFLFIAGSDSAVRILAVTLPASLAVRFAELIQQFLERGIVLEHRQKVGKPLRIAIERPQQPLQLGRVLPDLSIGIGLALSAIQTAGGKGLKDVVVFHGIPPLG